MRRMHINLFIQSRGHHEAAWRHPKSSSLPLTDIRYTIDLAQRAEASLFDSIFLADVLGLWNDVENTPFNWLEPITALAAVAMATNRIGLIATCSTTYTEPYNLARQFASLDHISRGRVGWNIVTTWSPQAASNFGTYPITASGGVASNYTIVYNTGTLTVAMDQGQVAFVTSLYQSILGRTPEPFGLDFWLIALADGDTQANVAKQIYNSEEAVTARTQHKVPKISEPAAYEKALVAQAIANSTTE